MSDEKGALVDGGLVGFQVRVVSDGVLIVEPHRVFCREEAEQHCGNSQPETETIPLHSHHQRCSRAQDKKTELPGRGDPCARVFGEATHSRRCADTINLLHAWLRCETGFLVGEMCQCGHSDDCKRSCLKAIGFQLESDDENDHTDEKPVEDKRLQQEIAVFRISHRREQFFDLDDEFAHEKYSDEMI